MTDPQPVAPRRIGWLVAAAAGGVIAVAIATCGLWALAATRETGSTAWGILTGSGAGVVFWGWISAGCWDRAHEPAPDPDAPAPVPRSAAFVVANIVLAVLFTAMVAGGLWAGVDAARDAERTDLVEHRVMVAAREADVTVDVLRQLDVERQVWIAHGWDGDTSSDPDPDPADVLLPVEGARVTDLAVDEAKGTAAVLFMPDEGTPCVVLDVDADDLLSTRTTNNC